MFKKQNVAKSNGNIPLSIKGLYKRYKGNNEFSIQDLNFEVRSGEFHGFIGANGAGKTTTIKSIIGAYAKIKGQIQIFGNNHWSIEAKKNIGYIPETANFPKEMNAFQYLKSMAFLSGLTLKKSKEFANKALNEVGMTKFKNRNPNKFSSGQKKKILLAQALIGEPNLIITDEPAANLDPKARLDFFNNLKKLQSQGKSIFISSHILIELAQYIDALTIIDDGKIIYSGKVKDALKSNELKYIFRFNSEDAGVTFINFVVNMGFKYRVHNFNIIVSLKTKNDVFTFMDFILKNKLEIFMIKEDIRTLSDIYEQYVTNVDLSMKRERN